MKNNNTQKNVLLNRFGSMLEKSTRVVVEEWPPRCQLLFHQPKRPVEKSNAK